MTKIIWLSLFALLANGANAQHRGGPGGVGGVGVGRGFGQGGFAPRELQHGRFLGGYLNRGNRSAFPYGYGYGWFGGGLFPYDTGADYGYPPQPAPMLDAPPPPQFMFQPLPRPVQGVIHDYTSSAPSPVTSPTGEPPMFGIVLKDGSVRSAVAVVVDDDGLKYTDPDGRNVQLSLYAVDREKTRNLNRERNLSLWLPVVP
jgi:hypothetical protein